MAFRWDGWGLSVDRFFKLVRLSGVWFFLLTTWVMRRNFSAYAAKVMSNQMGLGGGFAVYFTLCLFIVKANSNEKTHPLFV